MRNPYGWYPEIVDKVKTAAPELRWVGNPQLMMLEANELTDKLPACLIVPRKPAIDSTLSQQSALRMQRFKVVVVVEALPTDQMATSAEVRAGTLLAKISEALLGERLTDYLGSKIEMLADDDDPVYTLAGYAQFSLLFQFQLILTR